MWQAVNQLFILGKHCLKLLLNKCANVQISITNTHIWTKKKVEKYICQYYAWADVIV